MVFPAGGRKKDIVRQSSTLIEHGRSMSPNLGDRTNCATYSKSCTRPNTTKVTLDRTVLGSIALIPSTRPSSLQGKKTLTLALTLFAYESRSANLLITSSMWVSRAYIIRRARPKSSYGLHSSCHFFSFPFAHHDSYPPSSALPWVVTVSDGQNFKERDEASFGNGEIPCSATRTNGVAV